MRLSLLATNIPRILLFSLLLLLLPFPPAANALVAGNLESAAMVARDTGWATDGHHLFWTTSDGREWSDITPKTSQESEIDSVQFLNASTGRVVLSRIDFESANDEYVLASTEDSGHTWSVEPVVIPDLIPGMEFGGHADSFFLDAAHGWVNLPLSGNGGGGILLSTRDGGRSWTEPEVGGGSGGPFRFVTMTDGWMTSEGGYELYATSDGGKNWQEVSLNDPTQANATRVKYGLPYFKSTEEGLSPVTYSSEAGESKLTVFATADGGQKWKIAGSFKTSKGDISVAMPSREFAALSASIENHEITLGTILPRGDAAQSVSREVRAAVNAAIFDIADAGQMSFFDSMHGWLLVYGQHCKFGRMECIGLLSTGNGGVSWSDRTPSNTPDASHAGNISRLDAGAVPGPP